MPLPNLALPPDKAGYTGQAGETNIAVELDGGAPKIRADKLGAVHKIDVQWTISDANYNYLMAFYRTSLANGSLPFTASLILDTKDVQTYTVQFVPNTLKLSSISGITYTVQAQLYVTPLPPTTAADNAIIAAGPIL